VLEDYRLTGRGGSGVISIQISERNGKVIGALQVAEQDELLLISNAGTMVRTRVQEVSCIGRNTQGVRLINLSEPEKLIAIQRVEEIVEDESIETSEETVETAETSETGVDVANEDAANLVVTDESID